MTAPWLSPGAPLWLEGALFLLIVLVLVLGLAGSGGARRAGWLSLAGLAGLFAAAMVASPGGTALSGTFVLDEMALFAKRLFLGSASLSVLASLGMGRGPFDRRSTEYHAVLLVSVLGMLVLVSARELILLFVAFEVMSIPLYILTGFDKRDDAAPEAALKFFLIGTVSSAVLLYGLSLVFGVTGTTRIDAIGPALADGHPLMTLGLGLVLAGLGFKIAAVPFHMWVPDSYEAAGSPFVAWLSFAPKAAGFVAIFRLYLEGQSGTAALWVPLFAALAGVTIVAGNLMAIPQQNVKRLLAYSGIAHIGYLLLGLAAAGTRGVAMMLFYLVAYLFGNMGAFFVVQAVGESERSDEMSAYRGLARRSPLLALAMLLFLLSLGGIPFVAGFWAKLYVFLAAVERGMYALVLLGAVLTVVALYYYLQVARRMYIDAPERRDPVPVPGVLTVAIAVCAAGVVVMGLYPQPWVAAALRAAELLFTAAD